MIITLKGADFSASNIGNLQGYVELDINYTDDYYWNTQNNKAVLTALANNYWASEEIAVTEGEEYQITIFAGSSTKTHAIVLTDDGYNIIYKNNHSGMLGALNETIIVPAGATKMLLTPYASTQAELVNTVVVKKKN